MTAKTAAKPSAKPKKTATQKIKEKVTARQAKAPNVAKSSSARISTRASGSSKSKSKASIPNVDWTRGLNPEQAEAALHVHGPLLILAGAGSGKTTVLVSRTGNLLSKGHAKPEEICVLTFTNKAARELKSRVAHKIGPAAHDIWTGTFHSFGLKLLRRHHKLANLPASFGVIDQGDSQAIIKELLVNVKNATKEGFKVEKILSLINEWRELGRPKLKAEDEYTEMATVLMPKYLKQLDMLGVVDFEGLLMKPLQLFKEHPEILASVQQQIQFMMVDEFQDTNRVQFKLVQSIALPENNLAVVGDDDQSIYGWRGACVSNILEFPSHYKATGCKVVRLERNYRSTPAIIDLANDIIARNADRHGKILRSDPNASRGVKPEVFVYENEDIECEEVPRHIQYFRDQGMRLNDIAILYRSNGQGGLIEAELRRQQIPYSITGGTGFFDRKETKDILAYLRCALNPNEVALRRILNVPSRGVGEATVELITKFMSEHNYGFVVACRKWREAGVPDKAGEGLDKLFKFIDELPHRILHPVGGDTRSTGELLIEQFVELGFKDYLRQISKDDMALSKKWQLVEIFGRVLDSFITRGGREIKALLDFVDAMELRDPGEDTEEEANDNPKVQLLTLHACKGLEFPAVILIGVEEDLIPHRTLGSDISEERRLFYVGVTRAKDHLILTRAKERKRFGRWAPVAVSRFLAEVPGHLIQLHDSGYRPVNAEQKTNMLADLFKKIEGNIEKQKLLDK